MENIFNLSKVEDSRTKEYFKEILANYSIGSYRSSVVQLYTVTISDLLFKLENISDEIRVLDEKHTLVRLYDDIKNRIETEPYNSEWETILINKIHDETELIDNHTIVQLKALRKIRNLSAHPSFIDGSHGELSIFNPSQNEVITFIKIMYEKIFIRPPFYIGNTVHYFTETLKTRKSTFENDFEFMESYLKENFFSKMDDSLLFKLFIALWKMTFLIENDDVERDREVLYYSILALAKYSRENKAAADIIGMLSKSNTNLKIDRTNSDKIKFLSYFLISNSDVYAFIDDIGQKDFHIEAEKNNNIKVLAHFLSEDLDTHIENIDKPLEECSNVTLNRIHTFYTGIGESGKINRLFIKKYSEATYYDMADANFKKYIEPYYRKFSDDDLISYFYETNNNSQLHSRGWAKSKNSLIKQEVVKRDLEIDFDSDYKNIEFDIVTE